MRAAWGVAALVALSAWAESPGDFRFAIPLEPSGTEGLQRVELTTDVHRGAARADLGDLRVFNGRGERLAFAFAGEPAPAPPASKTSTLPLFPVRGASVSTAGEVDLRIRSRSDGTLVELRSDPAVRARQGPVVAWIADASRLDEPLRSLRFAWAQPPAGILARMRIEAGDDLATWRTVVPDAPMVDLAHEGARVRRDTVTLPAVRAKYLRITFQGPALALESVEAESLAGIAERPLRNLAVAASRGARADERVFAVGARVPVERIRVLLPQENSVVPVRIDSRDDPEAAWSPVASGTAYRIRREGIEVAAPPFVIAPRAHRYWRVTADARGGGFGEGSVALELAWLPRQVVFAVRGDGPYELAFGNARVTPATYGIATLVPGYRLHDEFDLPAARLGAMVERPGAGEPGFLQWLEDADGKRLTLWALLLAAVALLAAMAWGLARQVKAGAREAQSPPDGGP